MPTFPTHSMNAQSSSADQRTSHSLSNSDQSSEGGSGSERPGKAFRCNTCFKIFPQRSRLKKHVATHTKPLTCQACIDNQVEKPYSTAQPKELNKHYWVHHPQTAAENRVPKDEATCPECDYTSRKDRIKRHRESQHKKKR